STKKEGQYHLDQQNNPANRAITLNPQGNEKNRNGEPPPQIKNPFKDAKIKNVNINYSNYPKKKTPQKPPHFRKK
ncbi:hypothetical protein ACQWF9_24740, partial [Salmonella enterica subsp. enterica serovar Infantis]